MATVTNPGSFMATITHPTGNGYCRDRILRDRLQKQIAANQEVTENDGKILCKFFCSQVCHILLTLSHFTQRYSHQET